MKTLEVGCNDRGEVVINHPSLETDANGCGHIVFSPDQARNLARILFAKAADADGFPGTGEEGEYFIDFDTQIDPGKIQAVRVRIDLVTIRNMDSQFRVDLCAHPLYTELLRYVKANRK